MVEHPFKHYIILVFCFDELSISVAFAKNGCFTIFNLSGIYFNYFFVLSSINDIGSPLVVIFRICFPCVSEYS